MTLYFQCPFFQGGQQLTTNAGAPLSNGKIFTYNAFTTNAFPTWTTNTASSLNPNPIILDSNGRLTQEIWQVGGSPLKYIVTDSASVPVGITLDNVLGVNDTSLSFNQIIVINSVTSSDTSNAASANSVKYAFIEANSAFTAANNAANVATLAYNAANAAANAGVTFKSNNVTIHTGNQLNFNNTAIANIQVTTVGTLTNVAIVANAASSNTTANGHATLPDGSTIQWGSFNCVSGTVAIAFDFVFPVAVFSLTFGYNYTSPDLGYATSLTTSGFNFTNGNAGLVSYMAIGH